MKFNPFIFSGFDSGGNSGSTPGFGAPVASEASLPLVGNTDGDTRATTDSDKLWVWDAATSRWIDVTVTVTTFGSTPNANGYSITLTNTGLNRTERRLELQPADATNPGLVSTGAQSFGGAKTFNSSLTVLGSTTLATSLTGLVKATSGVISASSLVNADVDTAAAIARSKLASGTSDHVLINNGSGVMSSEAVLSLSRGGTGTSSTPTNGQLLIGNGTNYTLATLTGTSNQVSVSNAAGSITLSTPQDIAATSTPTFGGLTLTAFSGVVKAVAGVLSASPVVNADIDAAAAIVRSKLASGTANHVVINDGTGVLSSESTLALSRGGTGLGTTPTNGQLLIGNGASYTLATITGTSNQVSVANGVGTITLSTPQDIAAASSPTFAGLTLTAFSGVVKASGGVLSAAAIVNADVDNAAAIARTKLASGTADHVVINNGSGVMSSEATLSLSRGGTGLGTTPTNGQLLIGNGTNYTLSALTGTTDQINVTNGAGSITLSTPQNIATTSSPTFAGLTLTAFSGVVKAVAGVLSASALSLTTDVTGVLPIANGGTNSSTALSNNRVVISSGGAIVEHSAITGSRALESNASGLPVASSVTSTELSYVSGVTSSIQTQIGNKISSSEKGAANGVATLDAGGKVPVAQLPSSIMTYEGVWNASTNTPTLADGVGDTGQVYRVSVAGTQDLGSGSITFGVGDYVIYSSTGVWEKSDSTDAVVSVNNQTGVVTLTTTNISEGTNLYFTDERAQDAVGGAFSNTTTISLTYNDGANTISADVNALSLTNSEISATAAIARSKLASGTANHVLINDGSGVMSSEATLSLSRGGTGLGTTPTNGQLLIGNGSGYTLAGITGTSNQITVTNGAGTITLSTPQNIHTGASPTFAGLTLTGFTGVVKGSAGVLSASALVNADVDAAAGIVRTKLASGTSNHVIINDGSGVMSSEATLAVSRGGTNISSTPTNGQLLIGNGLGYVLATITAGTGINVTNGAGSITVSAGSTGDIAETSFTAADNQVAAANVTGFAFANAAVRSFSAHVSIVRGSTYSKYTLEAIQKAASWEMDQSFVGDDCGITFSITSSGQVQYTSTNTGSSATVKFRALVTTV